MPGKRTKYTKRKSYKAFKLAPRVRKIITSMEEKKHQYISIYNATALNSVPIGTSWGIYNLMCNWNQFTTSEGGGIAQGSDFNQRIGERIKVLSNEITLKISPVTANVSNEGGTTCRVVIFLDREPHFALAAGGTVFNTNDILGQQNLTQKSRFQIIKDFVHVMVPLTANGGTKLSSGPMFLQKFKINKKFTMQYSGTAGITNTINKYALCIAVVADGASCCGFDVQNQITYTDD